MIQTHLIYKKERIHLSVENIIFSQLISNEEFARKIVPHLKEEYFSLPEEKILYKVYNHFFIKHNRRPSKEALLIDIEKIKTTATVYTALQELINQTVEFDESLEWLMETTESYCKERALFSALKEAVLIVDGQSKTKTKESIPTILQEALSICFDTSLGHDYLEDAMDRFDYYHLVENRIPTGIDIFDKITKKGFPRKTLNVLLAPPHGGKSLVMVNLAAGALRAGHNVLYISMEMAAEEIGRRFDVHMMNIDFDTLESIPKNVFSGQIEKIKKSSVGKLKINEYPTGGADAGTFRALLQEYKTKQNFIPDLIVVDYMSICRSEIYKNPAGQNSYTLVGSIGKELRALAKEANAALVTAIQTTRSGVGNSDVDISHTSESFGIPAIADFFAAIIATDELKELNQMMFKQLKNRYSGLSKYEKFVLGVDLMTQTLIQLEDSTVKPEVIVDKKKKTLNTIAPAIDLAHKITSSNTLSFDHFIL